MPARLALGEAQAGCADLGQRAGQTQLMHAWLQIVTRGQSVVDRFCGAPVARITVIR
jgi:hypothetical protein